jgi:hypothetical protein
MKRFERRCEMGLRITTPRTGASRVTDDELEKIGRDAAAFGLRNRVYRISTAGRSIDFRCRLARFQRLLLQGTPRRDAR